MAGEGTGEKPRDGIYSSVPLFDSHDPAQIHLLFQAVWESAADAMALSDPDGIVLAANPAYCDFYGYLMEELVGQSFAVIFPEEQRPEVVQEYRRYFVEKVNPQGVEAAVRPGDGRERLVDVRYSFIERGGQRIAMLSVIRDVTERARLRQSEHELLREKDSSLLAVSHDLKTPLTAIKGHAQLLLRRLRKTEEVDPVKLVEGLHQIETTAIRMSHMIDGLLDASIMRRGETLPMHPSRVDLVALVHDVVESQKEASDRHRLVIEATHPVIGWWDEPRLHRVVENLVANALKYSVEGGTVLVSLREEQLTSGTEAVLRVTDTGIGIPEHDQERIFEPFYRGTNVWEAMPGTGIGLAGVRQIVELHGGSISLQSVEGEGSTFTVRLPLSSPER